MILDERLEFVDAVALNTGAPATFLLGDVVDLWANLPATGQNRDIGLGEELFFVATVDTTATSGGAATLVLNLITDDNSAMASPAIVYSTAAIPVATLVAGYRICAVALPIEGVAYERYLGISQTTGTAAFTAGKINAFLTKDVAKWRAYQDADN